MKFKAVVFDLDGTLLDTLDDLADSMNSVLKKNGYPVHDTEAYKSFIGNGMRALVIRAFPENMRDDVNVDIGLADMRDEYSRRWSNKTRPYNGMIETLEKLSDKNLKLCVLSNKADEFTKLMIKKFFPSQKFSLVYGERPGIPKKPDPQGALEIAHKLGIMPSECLYLGDSGVDMQTAVSAGMYPVGVLWGFRKAEELVSNGARILVAEPSAILDIV